MEDKLLYKDLTYVIRGILFEVHNELGRFRNEEQYGDALEAKLKHQGIRYIREHVLAPSFYGERRGRNKVDFLIEDVLVVELKHVPSLSRNDYFQCERYLKSLNLDLGLLVNFCGSYLVINRVLNYEKYHQNNNQSH